MAQRDTIIKKTGDGWTHYEPPPEEEGTSFLSGWFQGFASECARFARVAREVKLAELPRYWDLTWEAFCLKRLHQPPEVVEAIIRAAELFGEDVPVPPEVAERLRNQCGEASMKDAKAHA